MQSSATQLHDIKIYPYYRNVPIEVEPVLSGVTGHYVDGWVLSHQYYELTIREEIETQNIKVGASYSVSAHTSQGRVLQTHWLYCTSVSPVLTFGVTRNWSKPRSFSPLLASASDPLMRLEKLTDLVVVFTPPSPAVGMAGAQIGQLGWLVMTSLTTPYAMGILIEGPSLMPMLSEGSENISISATCVRTLQSIGLDSLVCVKSETPALFLKESI